MIPHPRPLPGTDPSRPRPDPTMIPDPADIIRRRITATLILRVVAVLVALAALVPIHILGEMVSIGTLFAFILVCSAVIYLRRSDAAAFRPFRVPGVPWVPVLGILFCLLLMVGLPLATWLRFLGWMVIGVAVYFLYSKNHSRLATGETIEEAGEEVHYIKASTLSDR